MRNSMALRPEGETAASLSSPDPPQYYTVNLLKIIHAVKSDQNDFLFGNRVCLL